MRVVIAMFAVVIFAQIAHAENVSPRFGVNIHFTHPQPGEMQQIADAGFSLVRMDLLWAATEKKAGVYDFSDYDVLVRACEEQNIGVLLILDYRNPIYDDNLAPHTDAGRAAFARWSVAAVQHFKGRDILWEIYNEPNISFWHPRPNADDYAKLALVTAKAIRAAAPDERIIAPASSQIDLPFLETAFKAGLLSDLAAVSVHPYRPGGPETVASEYAALRQLIRRYARKDRTIPIYSGEWGYSAAWDKYDPDKQAQMLARQWMTNLACEIPVSIWYDWKDDGTDPKEPEHHFGTLTHDRAAKPAYRAAQAIHTQLAEYTFCRQLPQEDPQDFVVLFAKRNEQKLVAWTTATQPHVIVLPSALGYFANGICLATLSNRLLRMSTVYRSRSLARRFISSRRIRTID